MEKDQRLRHIPFVFYTATYTDPRDEEFALSLGAERFIHKPAEPNEFLRILHEVIALHEAGRLVAPREPEAEEEVFYRTYNEALIRKLEDKMLQVQDENRALAAEIARRAQAEEDVARAKRYWESIFHAIGQPAFVLDANHRIVQVNRVAQDIVGMSEADLIGRSCYEVFHGLVTPIEECPLEALLLSAASRTEKEVEAFGRRFIVSCTPVADAAGRWQHIIHVATDVTPLREAQEDLRRSEEKLRGILESLADGVTVTNLEGVILDLNDAALRMYGSESKDEVIGANALEFIAERDRPRALANMARTLEEGSASDLEYMGMRKDGSEFPVEISTSVLRDRDGRPSGFVAITKDISARKRLEQQLLQSQKMEVVGRLAGGIAHDFNNILTAITGYGTFVLDALPPHSPLRDDVEQIMNSASRAADLTRQLLAFSRRSVVAPRVVDLNQVILEMDKLLRRLIGENIELVTLPAQDLGLVRVDPIQIEQALINLAVNARDAMPAGGRLTIETANVMLDEEYAASHPGAEPGEYVMVAVSDTGVGMTPEVMSHLFEPFFTTKEPGKGTGLGLAVVFGVVKQHDGNIYVYSEPGAGSTFKIYLPRVREPKSDLPPRDESGYLPGGTETILVAEDEGMVRGMICRTLRQLGYNVLEATNGEEALRLARKHVSEIRLVISDVVMPQMGGRELASALASLNPGLAILFVSGYTDDSLVRSDLIDNALNFLQKPFTSASLARKVRQILDATA